ncbi:hypothetical protein PCE1_004468 [Barthelona sp. PCE]
MTVVEQGFTVPLCNVQSAELSLLRSVFDEVSVLLSGYRNDGSKSNKPPHAVVVEPIKKVQKKKKKLPIHVPSPVVLNVSEKQKVIISKPKVKNVVNTPKKSAKVNITAKIIPEPKKTIQSSVKTAKSSLNTKKLNKIPITKPKKVITNVPQPVSIGLTDIIDEPGAVVKSKEEPVVLDKPMKKPPIILAKPKQTPLKEKKATAKPAVLPAIGIPATVESSVKSSMKDEEHVVMEPIPIDNPKTNPVGSQEKKSVRMPKKASLDLTGLDLKDFGIDVKRVVEKKRAKTNQPKKIQVSQNSKAALSRILMSESDSYEGHTFVYEYSAQTIPDYSGIKIRHKERDSVRSIFPRTRKYKLTDECVKSWKNFHTNSRFKKVPKAGLQLRKNFAYGAFVLNNDLDRMFSELEIPWTIRPDVIEEECMQHLEHFEMV